jgi:Cu-Zn family superoxide dismutase
VLLACNQTVEFNQPLQPLDEQLQAGAAIQPRSGSTVAGTAIFLRIDRAAVAMLSITGASPGDHAVHLHTTGDCSAADAMSAGGHWNPAMHNHGAPYAADKHLGDMGNITIGADGRGSLTLMNDSWSIDDGALTDLIGKAIIFHASRDDFSQPVGNAGGRQGCGVISLPQP